MLSQSSSALWPPPPHRDGLPQPGEPRPGRRPAIPGDQPAAAVGHPGQDRSAGILRLHLPALRRHGTAGRRLGQDRPARRGAQAGADRLQRRHEAAAAAVLHADRAGAPRPARQGLHRHPWRAQAPDRQEGHGRMGRRARRGPRQVRFRVRFVQRPDPGAARQPAGRRLSHRRHAVLRRGRQVHDLAGHGWQQLRRRAEGSDAPDPDGPRQLGARLRPTGRGK